MRVTTTQRYDVNGNAKITVKWRTVDGVRQKTVRKDLAAYDAHAAAVAEVLGGTVEEVQARAGQVLSRGARRRVWNVSHP